MNLACPYCHSRLKTESKRLSCQSCHRSFPIQSGIITFYQPYLDRRLYTMTKKDLAFSKKYKNALTQGKPYQKLYQQEEEFFDRATFRNLAATAVDHKAFFTFKNLSQINFKSCTVLDIGTGDGKEANFLLKEKVKQLACLDISKDFLFLAKKRIKNPQVSFIQADATRLPFQSQSFDLAIFFGTLHHIPNYKKALQEAARVASQIAIIAEPATNNILRPFIQLTHWNTEYDQIKTHRFDPSAIKSILNQSGLRTVKTKTNFIYFPFPLLGKWKNHKLIVKVYFIVLNLMDSLFGFAGHNLTIFAAR